MSEKMKFFLIAAACRNMGIGYNGDLPWRLKNEMAYFNRITTTTTDTNAKNAVVMGRKTWFSIPAKFRPLKDRINVVLSRNSKSVPKGAHFLANALDDVVDILSQIDSLEKVFIIGGENIYREAIDSSFCYRIYLTRIDADFECDTFFPKFDTHSKFLLVSDPDVPSEEQEEDGLKYKFEVYENLNY